MGLDPSRKLLEFARFRVGPSFQPVVGVAESLPFTEGSFAAVLSCFALRDVRLLAQSLREVSRVLKRESRFALVDVGKPDNAFWRNMVWLYVRHGMPIMARLLIRNRILGNPFKMIIPTFQSLLTNSTLQTVIAKEVGPSNLRQYMWGGLVTVQAEKLVWSLRSGVDMS